EEKREAAIHPIIAIWQAGFYDQEGPPTDYWRWCGSTGKMQIVNRTGRNRQMNVEMLFTADSGGNLEIKSGLFNERLSVDRWGQRFAKTIVVPAGIHTIEFECDARRVLPPNDFRELVFRVRNFKLTSTEVQPVLGQETKAKIYTDAEK